MCLDLETGTYFQDRVVPSGTQLAGWAALVQSLGIHAPVRHPSCVSEKHIGGSHRDKGGFRIFDKRYWPGSCLADHLTFALRHENIDLLILKRACLTVPKTALEEFVRSAPTGGVHTRRVWFYYELLTGQTLDVDDATNVMAINALDAGTYFTGKAQLSRRHKIRDNLIGKGDWCPVIRRTELLESFTAMRLTEHASEMVGRTLPISHKFCLDVNSDIGIP
ncbi:MAG: cell filamentation protein Fic, partial [Gammaproteobacteria bacterium]|nr:cell filamentation protein Fic [Gammaproteobacteria bacterium]